MKLLDDDDWFYIDLLEESEKERNEDCVNRKTYSHAGVLTENRLPDVSDDRNDEELDPFEFAEKYAKDNADDRNDEELDPFEFAEKYAKDNADDRNGEKLDPFEFAEKSHCNKKSTRKGKK